MIVPMMHVDLVCVAADKRATLAALRNLGAVQLDLSSAAGPAVDEARRDAEDAAKAVRLVRKAREVAPEGSTTCLQRSISSRMALAISMTFWMGSAKPMPSAETALPFES